VLDKLENKNNSVKSKQGIGKTNQNVINNFRVCGEGSCTCIGKEKLRKTIQRLLSKKETEFSGER
jgi:hypothetical protein